MDAAGAASGRSRVALGLSYGRRQGDSRRRRPHALAQQPRQSAVPAGRLHQGRGHRLLRRGRRRRAPPPRRPHPHPQALARRHRCAAVLREERPPRHTVVGAHGLDGEHGDDGVDYVVAEELPTLVWLANLAALELHVPQWKVDADDRPLGADLLVFDLDPGPPADIVDCLDVAFALRRLLEDDGLTAFPKTSGNKGAQLYVPIEPIGSDKTSAYAKRMAERLETALPDLVLSSMDKKARRGKVFIDWSQNNGAKTTVAPYSLRGIDRPTVSTPITWDEAADASSASDLRFESAEVVARVEEHGDLFGSLDTVRAPLP